MNKYYFPLKLLFLLLIILCLNAAVTHGETKDAREEQDSEEFRNAVLRQGRNDNRNEFVELLNFMNSINNTLAALSTKFAVLDRKFITMNDKIEVGFTALNKSLSAGDNKFNTLNGNIGVGMDSLNETLSAQNNKFITMNEKIEVGFTALNKSLSGHDAALKANNDKVSQKINLLLKNAFPDLNTPESIRSLIRTQAEEIKMGDSFNGSLLFDVESRAAQAGYNGWHTSFLFVNHLDEAIDDFKIYKQGGSIYNPAPNSVPGRTEEVFTLVQPVIYGNYISIAFSYSIPSLNIRIAAISDNGAWDVGLAFVSEEADMQTYFDSHQGIAGASAWVSSRPIQTRNLWVSYKTLYAVMVAYNEDNWNHKATVKIELTQFPLDD